MTSQARRNDAVLVPVIIVMAIVLFVAAYVGGELIVLRVLRQDANQIVHSWREYVTERIGPDLALLSEEPEPGTGQASAGIPRLDPHLTRVSAADIIDTRGRKADAANANRRQPFTFSSPRDRHVFDMMRSSKMLEYHISGYGTDTGARTIFYVPIVQEGALTGAIRLEVDQTASGAALRSAFGAIMILTLALATFGLSGVLFILWRRIKEHWQAEEEVRFLALHDTLTNLPNRARFNSELTRALATAERNGTSMAVICIDVDNFKDVNDTLGHPAGDALLRSIAGRILASSGPNATVARLSGDEFAVIIEEAKGRMIIEKIVQRYMRTASIPHEIDGHEVTSSLSLGIAIAPHDGRNAETLLKSADLALYRAKADGRATYRFFTQEMDRELRRRRLVEAEMRKGFGSDQFRIHYQPQFELDGGRLAGFEALMRWRHPELGDVPPSVFIPIAEECGMIGPLGAWILNTACAAAVDWPHQARLAVNLSVAQFRSGDVAELVERALEETGLPPERLEVEITESLLLNNSEKALVTLNRLRDMGVSIALDDFGTGFSSLSYLSRFPFDKIKIDKSFVQQLATDPGSAAIVQAIITIGHPLNVTILAEGVESHEQAALLRAAGCHQVQGFLFGMPQPSVDILKPEVVRIQQALERSIA